MACWIAPATKTLGVVAMVAGAPVGAHLLQMTDHHSGSGLLVTNTVPSTYLAPLSPFRCAGLGLYDYARMTVTWPIKVGIASKSLNPGKYAQVRAPPPDMLAVVVPYPYT